MLTGMSSLLVRSRSFVAFAVIGCSFVAGCSNSAKSKPHDTFRAVFITDTHIIGPQYVCCSENSDVDNASIVHTVARLNTVRDTINAIQPPPQMVFVMGDVVHKAHLSTDPQWYRDNVNAYSIARDIFKTFTMPVYMTMGNHDYEVDCGDTTDSYDRQFSEDRFMEFFGQPPYQAIDYHGWKFVLIDSQRGDTFDITSPHCNTGWASMGDTQMAWATAQLQENKPTFIMSHIFRLLYDSYESGPYPGLPQLLDASPNVKGFLAGHSHHWVDASAFNNDVFHWTMGGTRYDPNNFWLVEFDGTDGTYTVLDQAKEIDNSTCAQTWSYNGTPAVVPNAVDTGDCTTQP